MSAVQKLFERDGFNLTLRTIYLRECSGSLAADFEPLKGGQKLAGQLRKFAAICVRTEFTDTDGKTTPGLVFLTKFEFQYLHEEDPERVAAMLSATIATVYNLKEGAEFDQAAAFAWGESSALFHAWPYWREYAHATLARLNLPVALMPMLDIQSALDNAEQAAKTLPEGDGDNRPVRAKRVRSRPSSH